MELQDELIKSFTQAINPSGGEKSGEKTVYGVVARIEKDLDGHEHIKIKIDGSELETPATSMVKVGEGDRVFATIKDHSVVITGNISYPALTRIGNVYMTMTEDGLVIGLLDFDNKPTGYRVLISPSNTTPGVYIIDDQNQIVSTFGTTVKLGKPGSYKAEMTPEGLNILDPSGNTVASYGSTITIGNGNSQLIISDLSISNINIGNWAVFRAKSTNSAGVVNELSFAADLDGGGGIYVGENNPSTAYWGLRFGATYNNNPGALFGPSGNQLFIPNTASVGARIGGTKIAMVNDCVQRIGMEYITGAGSNNKLTIPFDITVPTGFIIGGVTQVYISNDDWALTSYSIRINGTGIDVKIHTIDGTVKTKPQSISIYYLLIRTS